MKKKSENAEIQEKENRPDGQTEMSDASEDGGAEKEPNVETENVSDEQNSSGADTPADTDALSEEEGEPEEADGEKLLFRDTTPELVSAAVRSMNQQGLMSVQYREEEETYAVYASTEEFERARELLIEILKDEAEDIRDRARTLEAKRTLRKMETTEMAPGFRPEKTPKEKYEDANSTAIAFLLVGALGIVFVVLEYFGIFFSLGLSDNVRYIFYPTMLVMFGAFLAVGFASLRSASRWKEKMFEENSIMNNVREYVEHDLIHEIRTLMAERVVRETEIEENAARADNRPAPEDALMQLASLIEGEFPGEEALEEAEQAVREAPIGMRPGIPEEADFRLSGKDEQPEEDEPADEAGEPKEGEQSDETETSDKIGEPEEGELPDETVPMEEPGEPEEDDLTDRDEMENVFNDYYAMEQEIHLRLIKEFPDLPANLLLEATEYVIQLVEENFEKESDDAYDETQYDVMQYNETV
ncbi:MAG: hypothetical protein LUE29_08635 [Lachnospiraceae bacterium]|nr:hypothetical protein [Lachnospiraceae bacterium]